MAVLSEQIDLEQTPFTDVDLIDGERAETTISLSDDPKGRRGAATDMLVLTDRRLIHLADDGRAREAVFIWLADIIAVRVGTERTGGVGGYVWGVLSVIAAILVWSIWDRPVLDVVAAGVLLLMGRVPRLGPHQHAPALPDGRQRRWVTDVHERPPVGVP